MKWVYLSMAVKDAISEYKKRDEPVPGNLVKIKDWVNSKMNYVGEDVDLDKMDLTEMLLKILGWAH